MATLDETLVALQAAVDAVKAADVPAPVVEDSVRASVEGVLTSEGWTAPVPAEVETPAEDATDAPAEDAPTDSPVA